MSTAATDAPAAPRRWRLAAWAPLAVLVALCAIIAVINPNFLSLGNAVRISQTAMIPLVLGMGATFIILMGSIDLSVEGVLTSAAVVLSILVLNGANANDYGLIGVAAVLCVGAAIGFMNGMIHVYLRIPSFMVTLGTWFIGVGAANALLGGGSGGVLQTLVGVLIVVVLANGMVLMGISPYIQQAVQGLMIIAAVALSLDRARMKIVK